MTEAREIANALAELEGSDFEAVRKHSETLRCAIATLTAERDALGEAGRQVELIDRLRAAEGHRVTICHDNADFGAGPNCTILVSTDYGQIGMWYFGETVVDCLEQAERALLEKQP